LAAYFSLVELSSYFSRLYLNAHFMSVHVLKAVIVPKGRSKNRKAAAAPSKTLNNDNDETKDAAGTTL